MFKKVYHLKLRSDLNLKKVAANTTFIISGKTLNNKYHTPFRTTRIVLDDVPFDMKEITIEYGFSGTSKSTLIASGTSRNIYINDISCSKNPVRSFPEGTIHLTWDTDCGNADSDKHVRIHLSFYPSESRLYLTYDAYKKNSQ